MVHFLENLQQCPANSEDLRRLKSVATLPCEMQKSKNTAK